MPNSEFLTVLRQEIADVEARLDALRRAESELLKTTPASSPGSEEDAIKSWHPTFTKTTKAKELVVSFMAHCGQEKIHRDVLFRAFSVKHLPPKKYASENKREGSIKAALSQNPDLFNYDPLTGMVSLKRR